MHSKSYIHRQNNSYYEESFETNSKRYDTYRSHDSNHRSVQSAYERFAEYRAYDFLDYSVHFVFWQKDNLCNPCIYPH